MGEKVKGSPVVAELEKALNKFLESNAEEWDAFAEMGLGRENIGTLMAKFVTDSVDWQALATRYN